MPKEYDFELVRGDTRLVCFGITDTQGNSISFEPRDEVIFTVTGTSIQKFLSNYDMTYENGVLIVPLTHSDTNDLTPKDYDYDVQVMLNGDEVVDTVWIGKMTLYKDETRI